MSILSNASSFNSTEQYLEAWDKCDQVLSNLSALISCMESAAILTDCSESYLAKIRESEAILREAMNLLCEDCERFMDGKGGDKSSDNECAYAAEISSEWAKNPAPIEEGRHCPNCGGLGVVVFSLDISKK
jgi:ssDNA-binding Zn-finger/Zn-ribbon topoisomerase 1